MSRRLHQYTTAVLAASVIHDRLASPPFSIKDPSAADPYKPRNRSKGEKARNRKVRGGRA